MKRFGRPRHSTIAAYLALFVALGGTGYAATQLPRNSVGAKQIKKNAVRSSKVKNRSLLAKDFKLGQLHAGRRGPAGRPGIPGPVKLVYVRGADFLVHANTPPASSEGYGITCPATAPDVVGGGYITATPLNNDLRVVESGPGDGGDPDGVPDDNWDFQARNAGASNISMHTWAICTDASSTASGSG